MRKFAVAFIALAISLSAQAAPKSKKKMRRKTASQTKVSMKKVTPKKIDENIYSLDHMPLKGQATGKTQIYTSEKMFRSGTAFGGIEFVQDRRAFSQNVEYGVSDTFSFGVQGQIVYSGEDQMNAPAVDTSNSTDADKELSNVAVRASKKIEIKKDKINIIGKAMIQPKLSNTESGRGEIGFNYNNRLTQKNQLQVGLNIKNYTGDASFSDRREVVFHTAIQRAFTPSFFAKGQMAFVNSSSYGINDSNITLSPLNHNAYQVSMGYIPQKSKLSFLVSYDWSHASTRLSDPGFYEEEPSEVNSNLLSMTMGYTF